MFSIFSSFFRVNLVLRVPQCQAREAWKLKSSMYLQKGCTMSLVFLSCYGGVLEARSSKVRVRHIFPNKSLC